MRVCGGPVNGVLAAQQTARRGSERERETHARGLVLRCLTSKKTRMRQHALSPPSTSRPTSEGGRPTCPTPRQRSGRVEVSWAEGREESGVGLAWPCVPHCRRRRPTSLSTKPHGCAFQATGCHEHARTHTHLKPHRTRHTPCRSLARTHALAQHSQTRQQPPSQHVRTTHHTHRPSPPSACRRPSSAAPSSPPWARRLGLG